MGHIFQLGTKYAQALDLKVLDQNGALQTVIMGSYGVGVSRAVACVAEGNHDELGLRWPREVSPVDVHVVATGKDATRDPEVFETAEQLTRALEAQGVSVLYDDRHKVSPGVKFKDSELLGVPTIVVVGKSLANGVVEVKDRATGERREVSVADAVAEVVREVRGTDA
jgi:prolyl-tRNA synthetase